MTPCHGTRETVVVEPSQCPSTFQVLAEREPLETETAPPSKAATRDRQQTVQCSKFKFVIDATKCERDEILFSNLKKSCTSMGIEIHAANWTWN